MLPDDDLCKGGSVTLVLLLQDDESKLRQGLSEATKETHDVSDLLCSETGCRVEMHEAKKSSKVKKLHTQKKEDLKMNYSKKTNYGLYLCLLGNFAVFLHS